jgi:predicted CXXCH cytochrome family protein
MHRGWEIMEAQSKGKWRALRIPFEFHRKLDRLESRRKVWALAAIVAGVILFVAAILFHNQTATLYSPGSVANVHAKWNSQCSECHSNSGPMRSDSLAASFERSSMGEITLWNRATDRKCQACHPVVTPQTKESVTAGFRHASLDKPLSIYAHSRYESVEAVESCASCHREHRGSNAMLNIVDDSACTRCHQDLKSFTAAHAGYKSEVENSVGRFDATHHPDFDSLKKSHSHIQFNHQRHMVPGLRLPDERGGVKLADLADADRQRYRKANQSDSDWVTLDCESCHAPDVSQAAVAPRQAGGDLLGVEYHYRRMPTYADNCRACHPLDYEPGTDKTAPHKLPADKIRSILRQAYREQFEAERKQSAAGSGSRAQELRSPLIPGHDRSDVNATRGDDGALDRLVEASVQKAELHLRKRCAECHAFKSDDASVLPDVEPPSMIAVWFEHASFNHYKHRHKTCVYCHENAAWDGPQPSRQSSDVLVPGQAKCLECHSRLGGKAAGTDAALYRCVECHTYHGGGNRVRPLVEALQAGNL